MKRLFGTDGVRGVAGEYPLEPRLVRCFGAALGQILGAKHNRRCRVALGRDTRESGDWLCEALNAGLQSENAEGVDAGVITTPGLAFVLQADGFDAGVMISASHNPFRDNGLKVFGPDGMKLSDDAEQRIESLLLDQDLDDPGPTEAVTTRDETLVSHYMQHLEGLIEPAGKFRGTRMVLDCANGAACRIGPEVFRHHGAEVETIGVEPNGRNINLDCGSMHLERLAESVREQGADLGLALDGDADRLLAVDSRGRILDGDTILFLLARRLKREGRLHGNMVVATIMSNFWLEKRLEQEGITLLRTAVGDKYVLQRMLGDGAVLGGEQSGHVILSEFATTGDGILCGLYLLDTILGEDQPLETMLDDIEPYPQTLINVRVGEKPDLRMHPKIGPVVQEIEQALDGTGRVVLRYSGTEPVARVMVEGADDTAVRNHAQRLVQVIGEELGG